MKILIAILFFCQFLSICAQNCSVISVRLSDKPISEKLLKKSDLITPYFHFEDYQTNYAVFMKNGLYGLIHEDRIIEPAKYDEIEFFGEELFRLQKDKETIITNCKGQKVIFKDSIEIINEFTCSDYLHYSLEGKEGINDFYNNQIIPPIYNGIIVYCSGNYQCFTDDSVFLLDNKSEVIWMNKLFKIDPTNLPSYSDGYRETGCDKDTAFLYQKDKKTKWLITFSGEVIDSNYHFGYKLFEKKLKPVITKTQIVPPRRNLELETKYKTVTNHYQCFYVQNENDKFGITDTLGGLIIPLEYDSFGQTFWSGNHFKAYAKKDNFWGVIDQNNKVVSDFKYADEPSSSLWFPKAEKGNFFREIFWIDLYGREYDSQQTRCLPDPQIYR